MKTETQLRAEVYNAISSIAPTFWLSRPTLEQTFPLMVYTKLDISSDYSFGIDREAENHIFQIDYYDYPNAIVTLDNNLDAIKTAMESIDYRLIGSQQEFIHDTLNKVVKVTRWERYNV